VLGQVRKPLALIPYDDDGVNYRSQFEEREL
jgi:hypothetical protein